jgi:hypothetical protein
LEVIDLLIPKWCLLLQLDKELTKELDALLVLLATLLFLNWRYLAGFS